MKFVLFNVIVAAALVFLFLRDRQNTVDMHSFAEAAGEAAHVGERLVKSLTSSGPGSEASTPAAGKLAKNRATANEVASEKIAGEEAKGVAPKTEREVTRPPVASELTPSPSTLPLPPAVEVAVRTAHPFIEGGLAGPTSLEPDVARRRALVLGEGPAAAVAKAASSVPGGTRFTLPEGQTLMTPIERRRELDALVEKMELMYLNGVGK